MTNKIKNNILLLSIAIPAIFFIVTTIFITFWFYKRKKRLRQERIELNSYFKNIKSNYNLDIHNNKISSISDESKKQSFYDDETNYYSSNNNHYPLAKPSQQISKDSKWGLSKNKITDITKRSYSTTYKMNDIIKNKNNIAQLIHNNKSGKLSELAKSEQQIAMEFNPNLSYNLEENNWGYNFATRGLDLNQPWTNGQYIQSFVESQNSRAAFNATDRVQSSDKIDSNISKSQNKSKKHFNYNNNFPPDNGYFY